MGYLHIENLYKNQDILMFKECYAMEKIHGTSAHIKCKNGKLTFFSGGAKHDQFVALFDEEKLKEKMSNTEEVTIFGEAYCGKLQAMSATYGKELKFVAFDVKIKDFWLEVPCAEDYVVQSLGLEFVHYLKVPCTLERLDIERDADSVQAIRNGMGEGHKREGIVIRPLMELKTKNDKRIIAKYKNEGFIETRTKREVSADEWKVLEDAEAIAEEWVTEQRLHHVMDKVFASEEPTITRTKDVIMAMLEDVSREAKGEIIETRQARKKIGSKTANMFKCYIKKVKEDDKNKTEV